MVTSRTTSRSAWLAGVAVLLTALALAGISAARAVAAPTLYWTSAAGTIGSVETDGSNRDPAFVTGASSPIGPAANASHLYWADTATDSIGRVDLDGGNLDHSFVTGATDPLGVALSSTHLLWNNPPVFRLGRAGLDGSGVTQNWFALGGTETRGITSDDIWIYWADGPRIGRAQLAAGAAMSNFVAGVANANDLAADAGHIYWTDPAAGSIGRANIDGTGADNAFITGLGTPSGIALDGTYVYWSDKSGNAIGRANLDGSDVRPNHIAGIASPTGLAYAAPDATPSRTSIAFADQRIETFGPPHSVTYRNIGGSPITPTKVRIAGTHPSDFLISYDACTGTRLAPQASCDVQVRFGPSAVGARTATLHLLTGTVHSLTVPLAGNGIAWPQPTSVPPPPTPVPPQPLDRADVGETGTPGVVRRASCRAVPSRKRGARRGSERTRCTISVTGASAVALRARLTSRGGKLLAQASGRPRGGRLTLELVAKRHLSRGRYRVTVTIASAEVRASSARWVAIR